MYGSQADETSVFAVVAVLSSPSALKARCNGLSNCASLANHDAASTRHFGSGRHQQKVQASDQPFTHFTCIPALYMLRSYRARRCSASQRDRKNQLNTAWVVHRR